MKKLLWIILLLPSLVLADHHRQHAYDFTTQYISMVNATLFDATVFFNELGEITPQQQIYRDFLFKYGGLSLDRAADVQAILLDPNGDLDAARRLTNQPKQNAQGQPNPMVDTAMVMLQMTNEFEGMGDSWRHKRMITRALKAWRLADRIAWHITDATREEVYLDPDFQ